MKVADYPLDTSDGAETYLGLSSSAIVKRYAKPAGGAVVFPTRTQAMTETLGPEIKTFSTEAFAVHGDKGQGQYARRSTAPYQPWTAKDFMVGDTCQNAAGVFYRLAQRPMAAGGDATNTLEPIHVTFTAVDRGDGYHWLRINQEPQWVRTVDRYTQAEAIDATHGGWWELQIQNGVVYIEQLGGRADYPGWFGGAVPTTGTDNYVPLMTAVNWVQFSPARDAQMYNSAGDIPPVIQFGPGRYKFTQTVILNTVVHIRGNGSDQDPSGFGPVAQLWFINTTGSAFCFMSNNIGPTEDSSDMPFGNNPGSSYGSILEGVSIHGTWDVGAGASMLYTDNTAAVRIRTMIECRHVQVNAWRSTGFHIHAAIFSGTTYPMEGNANNWRIIDCYVYSCGGHGMLISGNDANTGYSLNFTTHGGGSVRGCGLYDGSALGNTHIQPHIAGYGDRGVYNFVGGVGKLFQYSGRFGAGDPRVLVPGSPGSENTWYYLRDGAMHPIAFPQWVAGNNDDVLIKMPMFITNPYTVVVGPYIETNNTLCHTDARSVFGGTGTYTTTSAFHSGIPHSVSFEGQDSSPEYAANGNGLSIVFGGKNDTGGYANGMNFMRFSRSKDGGNQWSWGYHGKDITFLFGDNSIFDISTPSTEQTFGRNVPVPLRMTFYDPAFKNPQPPYDARIIGIRSGPPELTAGEYAKGEWYFHSNPSFTAAYSCITGGVIADLAWAPRPGGETIRIVSTTSGRFYRSGIYGNWSIEPSHTSGTQTYPPDTVPWTYLGNSVAVFKACAVIDAPSDGTLYGRKDGTWVANAVVVKQTNAYTVTNAATDRVLDANATTTDELADVLGTLIADLKLAGILT